MLDLAHQSETHQQKTTRESKIAAFMSDNLQSEKYVSRGAAAV
jgi:hypothetical protein